MCTPPFDDLHLSIVDPALLVGDHFCSHLLSVFLDAEQIGLRESAFKPQGGVDRLRYPGYGNPAGRSTPWITRPGHKLSVDEGYGPVVRRRAPQP